MLTTASIEGRLLFPLSELLGAAAVPDGIAELDRDADSFLNSVYFADSSLQPVENGFMGTVVLVILEEIAIAPFGDVARLVIGGGGGVSVFEARVRLQWLPGGFLFRIGLYDVAVGLRISPSILRPLKPGTNEPETPDVPLDIQLGAVLIEFGTDQPFSVTWTGRLSLPRCMLGQTGIIVEASDILPKLSAEQTLPAAAAALALPEDWRGVYVGTASVFLPDGLAGILPNNLALADCAIGNLGFSGKIDADWTPAFTANLFGIDLALDHIGLEINNNELRNLNIRGTFTLAALADADGNAAPIPFVVAAGTSGYQIVAGDIPPLKLGGIELDLSGAAVSFNASTLTNVEIGGSLRVPGLKGDDGSDAEISFDVEYNTGIYTVQASSLPLVHLGAFTLALDDLDVSFDRTGLRSCELAGRLTIPGLEATAGGPAELGVRIAVSSDDFALSVSALPPLKLGPIEIQLDRFSIAFGKQTAFATDIAGQVTIPGVEDAAGNPLHIGFGLAIDSNLFRLTATTMPAFEIAGIAVKLTTFNIGFDDHGLVAAQTTITGTVRLPAFKDSAGNPLDIVVTADLTDGFGLTAQLPSGELEVLDVADTIRIALNKLSVGAGAQGVRFSISGRIDNELDIPMIGDLLPSSITVNDLGFRAPNSVNLDVALAWRSGLTAGSDGSGGFAVDIPLGEIGAGLSLDAIHLGFRDAGAAYEFAIAFRGATLELGPVIGTVGGLGLKATIQPEPNGGNLGPLQVSLGFLPPTGIGLSLDAGSVRLGGFLFYDEQQKQYAGVVQLELKGFMNLIAIGLLTTKMPAGNKGFSLLVIIACEFEPPIAIGFGFYLKGVGGIAGVNRTAAIDALRSGLRADRLNSLLFPDDPIRNAPQIISDLAAVFPPAEGRFVFGPIAMLTWGSPALLTIELGLVLEMPDPVRLCIFGRLRVLLPSDQSPAIDLQLDSLGVINFDNGDIALDAVLFDSRVGQFTVTGEMALRAKFGHHPGFLLAIGGFHPRFPVPPGFPLLKRMAINLATGDNPRLRLESYLAVTSNTIQLGARLDLYIKVSKFSVEGLLAFNTLINLDPFSFVADLQAAVAVKLGGKVLLAVMLEMSIAGPTPWQVWGRASFKVLFFKKTVEFCFQVGEETLPPPPAPVQILPLLREELNKLDNWATQLPRDERALVVLREKTGATEPLAHPLAVLQVSQKLVPLKFEITRFGSARPEGDHWFELEVLDPGDGVSATSAQVVEEVKAFFAPAQFQEMSDDEKLSAPAFVELPSGIRFATLGYACPQQNGAIAIEKNTQYDEKVFVASIIDGVRQVRSTPFKRSREMPSVMTQAFLEQVLSTGSAGRAPLQQKRMTGTKGATIDGQSAQGFRLKSPTYAAASMRHGVAVPLSPSGSRDTEAVRRSDGRREAGPYSGIKALSYAEALEEVHRLRTAYPKERWRVVPYRRD